MLGLLLAELAGFGLFIIMVACSTKTIIIISVSTVVGLIVLWGLEKLVRKIFFRKKSQIIKLINLEGNQNLKKIQMEESKGNNKIKNLNSNSDVQTENTNNINSKNNIIENK